MLNGKGRLREVRIRGILRILVVTLSPAQWCSLCLHGTYMTGCHSVLCWSVINAVDSVAKQGVALKCVTQFRYVTEAFGLAI